MSVLFFYYVCNELLQKKAKRPPVEETASFLQALISSHGPDFLEKLFGAKARNALEPLGGVERVAIALSGFFQFNKFLIELI
jgi:hypothetical protein